MYCASGRNNTSKHVPFDLVLDPCLIRVFVDFLGTICFGESTGPFTSLVNGSEITNL